ncbi:MAG: T9SS type A sorting domain-containing protein [Saprospiraceae bacterium]|nr:T9SS type A sorting domain-containing protein [Saprospiraceae bacterium]
MKILISLSFFIVIFSNAVFSQKLVSATYKGARTKQQVSSLFSLPLIKYGAKYYKILYTSPDAKGNMDTLSGLLVLPDDSRFEYPRLVYQHGTSDCKKCVPSFYGSSGGEEGQLGLLFAGLGFVSILPDYVGMGEGRGFQTYVHAATTVSASKDMLDACLEWTSQNNIFTNDQLFITGYSQGGYASMALHKYFEEFQGSTSVTAAAHLSGPYSLSGVMRNLILGDVPYFYPAYIPNTVLGFNEVYGNLYADLGEFFKSEYVPDILKYYNGTSTLTTLNTKLIQLLQANTGASVGGRMIRDDVKAEIIANPDHPANKILKENDLYDWAPQVPTRIFYCTADDQVPFLNSVIARDTMLANGAPLLSVTDVSPNSTHGQCVTPALTSTVLFFLGLQKITTGIADDFTNNNITIYPNPVLDILSIDGLNEKETVTIFNADGQIITQKVSNGSTISNMDTSQMTDGVYIVMIQASDGRTQTHKLVKIR